jgi:hypothetical protein
MRVLCQRSFFILKLQHPLYHLWLTPHQQYRTALQELSAQLAQMTGQLRSNAEYFSNAVAADQAVLRNAEEKIGANFDVT